jgi:hypothetical protein
MWKIIATGEQEPPSGEWTFLNTEITDKSGRITYRIPATAATGYGIFPVKMVVRGQSFFSNNILDSRDFSTVYVFWATPIRIH